jgi:DNA-binding phage protein
MMLQIIFVRLKRWRLILNPDLMNSLMMFLEWREQLGDVARAKGMTQVAKDAGLSRESLYRTLSEEGNPSLLTILKVLEPVGRKLSVGVAPGNV